MEPLSFPTIHKGDTELFVVNCVRQHLAGMKGVLLASEYVLGVLLRTRVRMSTTTRTWCFQERRQTGSTCCGYFPMGAATGPREYQAVFSQYLIRPWKLRILLPEVYILMAWQAKY